MRFVTVLVFALMVFALSGNSSAQNCKLSVGTNVGGISDWMTEMPFKDMMKNARTWHTTNSAWVSGGKNQWDTDLMNSVALDENGYPLEMPLTIASAETTQVVETIWAVATGWPNGEYVVLYDGEGELNFGGTITGVAAQGNGRMVFTFTGNGKDSQVYLKIKKSVKGNHIRNIRVLMPGTESSYVQQPFNPLWVERLKPFTTLRFMDWGKTNNWGEANAWENYNEQSDTARVPWSKRSQPTHFTYANDKGVPYEMMIKAANTLKKDIWVCVPHNASDEYIDEMAKLFKAELDPSLKLYVEYSNEIWNWMFGQAQWLNKFGCVDKGVSWPEGTVPYIQNVMDRFSSVYGNEKQRIVRVVGVQVGWQDVAQRVVFNMREGSYDVYSPTAYFGFSEQADSALDALGANATVQDVAHWARKTMYEHEFPQIQKVTSAITAKTGLPWVYYEAGNHLTNHPFGDAPTWEKALLELHRDTSIYNMYHEWFKLLETLNTGAQPHTYMNFSFIATRSARYGSWGVLETLDQDTALIPAPKFKALSEYMQFCGKPNSSQTPANPTGYDELYQNYPNPFNPNTLIEFVLTANSQISLTVFDVLGREVATVIENTEYTTGRHSVTFSSESLASGAYYYVLNTGAGAMLTKKMLLVK